VLASFQDAIVRLVTDERLRTRWTEDPAGVMALFRLTVREETALRSIPRASLSRYASSLVAKRAHELIKAAPLTRRVCPSIEQRYARWLVRHPAPAAFTVLPPGVAEAMRALAALVPMLAADDGEACYAADLFTWETLSAASRLDGQDRLHHSIYAVHELIPDLHRGLLPIDPYPTRITYRFGAHGVAW
jgi:hypothetical protein